jgi:predicted metal-dependent peptidase
MYLPSLHKESLGMLAIGVDTSGSIGPAILQQVAGEITAIVQDCRPAKTVVIYCDAQVSRVEEFAPDEVVELHPKGGGGTAFKPVFDWLDENADEPVCALVYITDTYGNMQELTEPGYPVVWGLTEPVPRFEAPFGRTVEVF